MSHPWTLGRVQSVLLAALAAAALAGCPTAPPPGDDDAGDGHGDDDAPVSDTDPPGDPILDTGLDPEPLRAGPFKVLFDNAHAENAGNANWIIDDNFPNPSPASPTSTESWKGAISSWGYELWHTGRYRVETLAPGKRFTFNDPNNTQDLAKYDLLVVPEPNASFTGAEKTALLDFVYAGGGLFMVANHSGSDRNTDGVDSGQIWIDLAVNNGRLNDPFGIGFVRNAFTETPITNLAVLPDNRVLHGPFGQVTALGIHGGCSLKIDPAANSRVRGLIWRNGYPQGNTYVDFATSKYGNGRVAAIGDSSPADDNTGESGKDLFDGWQEAGVTNDILFLNASAWLVRDAGD